MKITTPDEFDILWEGSLEPIVPVRDDTKGILASIGKPVQWDESQMLGDKWKKPVGHDCYYLTRFAFSLRPVGRVTITAADFNIKLSQSKDKKPCVYDGFPREQLIEQKDTVTISLGPELKFEEVGASVGKVDTSIDFGSVFPAIHTDGLQESKFCWHYRSHMKYPLIGSRSMYSIIALPFGMERTMVTITLEVAFEDRFGPIRLSTPENERRNLRWVIGQK